MCLPFTDLAERTLEQGERAGLMYEIVHNKFGYRCGYVRLPVGHPWFGKDCYDISANVHGGLSFAAAGKPCPTHGAEEEWWIGFDCAHDGDAPDPILPGNGYPMLGSYGTARTQSYVRDQCMILAEAAVAAAGERLGEMIGEAAECFNGRP